MPPPKCECASHSRAGHRRVASRSRGSLERSRAGGRRSCGIRDISAVRSRSAALSKGGATLTMTSVPDGRATTLAQVANISWPRGLHGVAVRKVASGDTAMVEITFDALSGVTYTFTDLVSMVSSLESPQPLAHASTLAARPARLAMMRSRRGTPRRGAGAGRRTSRSMAIRRCNASCARCCSICFAAMIRAPASPSRPWDFPARATTAMCSGIPIPGCSPRSCSRIRMSRTRSSPSARARSHQHRRTRAPMVFAARCIRGRPTTSDMRRRRTSPRRMLAPRFTSTAMSRSRSGNISRRPATPRGLRARAFP